MPTELVAPSASDFSLRSRLQTGMVFNLIGAVFNQGSTFVANIVIANLLSWQTFGEYARVQSTLTALAFVIQFGMGYTSTKYVAELRSTDPRRAGNILGMLYALSIIVAGIVGLTLFA